MYGMALCAGIGGEQIGLSLVVPGYECICYVERDTSAARALVAGMEAKAISQAPIWDDIATFDPEPWRNRVDTVTASIPCQPFSTAGKRRHTADQRWLWHEVKRILAGTNAPVLFLENVPGFRARGLPIVLHSLMELGFDAQWGVLGAGGTDGVGAPHKRRRLFLLAYRRGDGLEILRQTHNEYWSNASRYISHRCNTEPELADSNSKPIRLESERDKREGGGIRKTERGDTEHVDTGKPMGVPVWPPGISSTDWASIPPGAQPAICSVAHGHVADGGLPRTEQIRLLGNAVVPVQAAMAWLYLCANALGGTEGGER